MSDHVGNADTGNGAEERGRPYMDRLLDHDYDGIREYDNPMPGLWVYLFYASIVFSALYWFNVPGIGSGKGRIAAYEAEVAAGRARHEAAPALPALSDADLLALAGDAAKLELGRATFAANCAACHGPDGGGVIGPNLADDYWVHGGRPTQILDVVRDGVLDKGMPAWGQVLKPDQVSAVAAYVTSLRGTRPANPKAPQGIREEPGPKGEE